MLGMGLSQIKKNRENEVTGGIIQLISSLYLLISLHGNHGTKINRVYFFLQNTCTFSVKNKNGRYTVGPMVSVRRG